jgi:hypothetical protein
VLSAAQKYSRICHYEFFLSQIVLLFITSAHIITFIVLSDVELDPELQGACKRDMNKFCKDPSHGGGKMVACLKKHMDVSTC